jgi:hypothetical protein
MFDEVMIWQKDKVSIIVKYNIVLNILLHLN